MSSVALSSEISVRPGDVLADKYCVERILGAGGMGVVVAARNLALGKPVAIKMLLPSMLAAPRAVERFEREARAVVQLKSEHVAEVLDIGKLASGAPYIVMELLEGCDFEELLRDRVFSVEEATLYVLQACEAVAEAHGLGIVHRDLKPRNLFLTHRLDGTPLVKVLDFGISKWTSADAAAHSLTRTSDVIGSPNYMSPEQIRSAKDVDVRTDVWSLGVVLFELLTGRLPFLADGLPQLCALILEQDAPLLATLRPDVPEELAAIVARCLERRPERRFQTIAELARALESFAPASLRPSPRSHLAVSLSRPLSSAPPEPYALDVPPQASSSARVRVSNGTRISWAETLLDGLRVRRRVGWSMLAAVPVLMLVTVSFVWFGLGGSRGAGLAATNSAVQASASGPSAPSPKLFVTPVGDLSLPAAAPPADSSEPPAPFAPTSSSAPEARELRDPPPPKAPAAPRPMPTRAMPTSSAAPVSESVSSSSSSAVTARPSPPALSTDPPAPPSTDDPFTPADRK